jgi:hypothetical protein
LSAPEGRLAGYELLDLPRLRESALTYLGKKFPAIRGHLEDAARSRHQFDINDESFLEIGFQTGGPGQIISHSAIGDSDLHDISPHWKMSIFRVQPACVMISGQEP